MHARTTRWKFRYDLRKAFKVLGNRMKTLTKRITELLPTKIPHNETDKNIKIIFSHPKFKRRLSCNAILETEMS